MLLTYIPCFLTRPLGWLIREKKKFNLHCSQGRLIQKLSEIWAFVIYIKMKIHWVRIYGLHHSRDRIIITVIIKEASEFLLCMGTVYFLKYHLSYSFKPPVSRYYYPHFTNEPTEAWLFSESCHHPKIPFSLGKCFFPRRV